MSTRITPAFRIATTDATRLAAMIHGHSEKIRGLARAQHARVLAQDACRLVDVAIARNSPWTPRPLSKASHAVNEASLRIERSGLRDPRHDFGMEVSLIPDRATDSTYGVIHCDHPEWIRSWMRLTDVEDFSWWNSTDRPARTTAAQWRHREETWERLMPSMIPAQHGFSATMSTVRMDEPERNPLRFQPDLQTRKLAMARDIVIGRRIETTGDGRDEGILAMVSKAQRWLRTDEGAAELAALISELRLPRRVTKAIAWSEERPSDGALDLV